MAESQVQLKREEIVGDEVILSDINPSTTSDSVTHSTNGMPLDEELSRIWNSINDKLSRVVNSVNARTGVVVLTAEDVGLGNVDNTADANKSVSSAATLTTARTIDGVSFNGSANIIHYGACSTAAATTPKVLACTGFTLTTGAEIIVKFNNTNTASNPQLNVNSTGAKYIRYKNVNVSAGYLEANRLYHLVYDGSYYQIIDGKPDSDNTNIIINDSSTIPSSIENGDLWFQLTGDTSITNGENEQF